MTDGLTGLVITKSDKIYNIVRRNANLYFGYYPRVIVYPNNIVDVVNAVNWARKKGLNIRCEEAIELHGVGLRSTKKWRKL